MYASTSGLQENATFESLAIPLFQPSDDRACPLNADRVRAPRHAQANHVGHYLNSTAIETAAFHLSEGLAKYGVPSRVKRTPRVPQEKALPPVTSVAPDEADQPSRAALHAGEWSIKSFASTADVLRSLSSAEKPFAHLMDIAKDLYAIAFDSSLSQAARDRLKDVAIILDAAGGLNPKIAMVHNFGQVARIGADVLDGKEISAEDEIALVLAYQNVMALKRNSDASVSNAMDIAEKAAGAKGPGVLSDFKNAVHDNRIVYSGGPVSKSGRRRRPIYGGTDFIAYRYFESVVNRKASPPESGVPPAPDRPPEKAASDVSSIDLGNHLVADVDEYEADSFSFTYTEAGTSNDVDAPPESPGVDTEHDTEHDTGSPVTEYAWIEDVPVRRRVAPNEVPQWQAIDLTPYAVSVVGPAQSVIFAAQGRDYIQLDGHTYGIRQLQGDKYSLVSRTDSALPHVPLVQQAGIWRVKAPATHGAVTHVGEIADRDGMVRRGGRKIHLFQRTPGAVPSVDDRG